MITAVPARGVLTTAAHIGEGTLPYQNLECVCAFRRGLRKEGAMRRDVSKINPESPAIGEVADVIESCFPGITLLTTNNASPGTRHTSGLAIDIMLDSTKADTRSRAEGMIAAFIKLNTRM